MNSLIIGAGEVGTALYEVLINHYPIWIRGKHNLDSLSGIAPEIIHICFPYSDEFVEQVKDYQKQYKPKYTVIHSTVPVGISAKCGAYHSPIRGVHPNLDEGIKTFIKYLAPANQELKEYFEKAGIKIKLVDRPENTEALKLWSTAQYGLLQIIEIEIHKYCEENGLDFNIVYNDANRTYNEGYKKIDISKERGDVTRPILKYRGDKIGGHCVIPNLGLLNNKLTKLIQEYEK